MRKFILGFFVGIISSGSILCMMTEDALPTEMDYLTTSDKEEWVAIPGDDCQEKCGFVDGRFVSCFPDPENLSCDNCWRSCHAPKDGEEGKFCTKLCRCTCSVNQGSAPFGFVLGLCLLTEGCRTCACKICLITTMSICDNPAPLCCCLACYGTRYCAERYDKNSYVKGFDRGRKCLKGDCCTCSSGCSNQGF